MSQPLLSRTYTCEPLILLVCGSQSLTLGHRTLPVNHYSLLVLSTSLQRSLAELFQLHISCVTQCITFSKGAHW